MQTQRCECHLFSYCLLFRIDPALFYPLECSSISNPMNPKQPTRGFLAQTGRFLRVKVFNSTNETLIAGFACAIDVHQMRH